MKVREKQVLKMNQLKAILQLKEKEMRKKIRFKNRLKI